MCSLTATYGPNHDVDEPDQVVVSRDRKTSKVLELAPLSPALAAQRRAINTLTAGTLRPCTSAKCQR